MPASTSSAARPFPELLVALVRSGEVCEERIDVSARRLLREKFRSGSSTTPSSTCGRRDGIVGSAEFRAAGEAAQRAR